jgi:hypothetical protein
VAARAEGEEAREHAQARNLLGHGPFVLAVLGGPTTGRGLPGAVRGTSRCGRVVSAGKR